MSSQPTSSLSRAVTYKKLRYLGGNIILENDNAKSLGWIAKAPGVLETLEAMAKSG